jgi:hypothetical protein
MSSEQALNNILDIFSRLETYVLQDQEKKKETAETKADKTITDLLQGIIDSNTDAGSSAG